MANKSRKQMTCFSVCKVDEILKQHGLKRQQASRILYGREGYLGDRCLEAKRGIGTMSVDRLEKFCEYFDVDYNYMTTRPYNHKDFLKEQESEPLPTEWDISFDDEEEEETQSSIDQPIKIINQENLPMTFEKALLNFAGRLKETFGILESDLENIATKKEETV